MKTVLRVEEFEDRVVPTIAIDSAPEAYSWVLVNTLRQNPAAFANNLQGLVNGTVSSAFGSPLKCSQGPRDTASGESAAAGTNAIDNAGCLSESAPFR